MSHSCQFVKKNGTKLLRAYVQCVYIVKAKYQIVLSKAVVEVDLPMKVIYAYTKAILVKYCPSSHSCYFDENHFLKPNSFMHMFNVSTL